MSLITRSWIVPNMLEDIDMNDPPVLKRRPARCSRPWAESLENLLPTNAFAIGIFALPAVTIADRRGRRSRGRHPCRDFFAASRARGRSKHRDARSASFRRDRRERAVPSTGDRDGSAGRQRDCCRSLDDRLLDRHLASRLRAGGAESYGFLGRRAAQPSRRGLRRRPRAVDVQLVRCPTPHPCR